MGLFQIPLTSRFNLPELPSRGAYADFVSHWVSNAAGFFVDSRTARREFWPEQRRSRVEREKCESKCSFA